MLLNSIIREDKKRKKEMSLFVVPEKEDLFPQQKTGYNAWLMPKVMLALANITFIPGTTVTTGSDPLLRSSSLSTMHEAVREIAVRTKKRPTPLLGVGPRTLGEMPISS